MKIQEFGRVLKIIGLVDDNPRLQGMLIAGYEVLGTTNDIPSIVEEQKIGLIFFAIAKLNQSNRNRILEICHGTNVQVVDIPHILDLLRGHFLANGNDVTENKQFNPNLNSAK